MSMKYAVYHRASGGYNIKQMLKAFQDETVKQDIIDVIYNQIYDFSVNVNFSFPCGLFM